MTRLILFIPFFRITQSPISQVNRARCQVPLKTLKVRLKSLGAYDWMNLITFGGILGGYGAYKLYQVIAEKEKQET